VSAPQDPLNIRGTSAPAIQIAKAFAIAKGSLSLSLYVDPLPALLEQLVHSDNGKVVSASCPGTDVLSVLQATQFWCVGTRDISRLPPPFSLSRLQYVHSGHLTRLPRLPRQTEHSETARRDSPSPTPLSNCGRRSFRPGYPKSDAHLLFIHLRSANRRSLGRAARRIASLTIRRRPTPSAAVALRALAERTAPRWFPKPWAARARSTTAKRAPNCFAPSNALPSLSPEAVDSSSLFPPVTGLTFLCSPLSQPRFHHLASRRKGPHGVSRAGWIPFSALRPRPTPAPRPLEPALPPRPSQSRHTDAPGSSCGGWCGPTPGGRKSSRIPSHPVVRRRTPVVGHKHEALVLLFAAAALGPSFARGLLVRANTDNLNSASAVRERQKTHSPIWPQV
jgi:hypothetical protein